MKKRQWKRLLILTMAATLASTNICSFADEIESRKMSILQVTGREAYVTKNAAKMTAVGGMKLGEGNQVSTGKASYVYIETDHDKTLKLDDYTTVEIEKASAKSLKLTLTNGELFFNVEQPLKADEELSFQAAQTSMSIRGTSGIFVYHWNTLTFYLIEGTVEWDLGDGQTLTIQAGQKVELVRQTGEETPGSETEAQFVLKQVSSFHWSELSMEQLKTVLENKDHLDLSAIGLDSEEEQAKAEAAVQEYEALKKAQEEEAKAKAAALKAKRKRSRERSSHHRENPPISNDTVDEPDSGSEDTGSIDKEFPSDEDTPEADAPPEEEVPEEGASGSEMQPPADYA